MGRETDDELPRSLAVLWGRTDRRPRGPSQALSLERIVAAAIEIADAEGLQALSMAHLAERLGCATMSLYRHVASKEDLLVFMIDAAPGKPPVIDVAADGWRGGLERWAWALRSVYYRRPWTLEVTIGRPPLEPGQLAWLDCGLRTLAGTGLSPNEKLGVILLVLNYVRGEAQLHAGLPRTNGHSSWGSREAKAWYGRTLARLIDAERFPALAELSAAGSFEPSADGDDGAADFDFGLARILDGVGMRVRVR
ncbi:TetR/AcrR family transcriptional regulator [Archangium lipolyticum]|uniref:TetR/AcrR family transcriptional regulator n=1 Tax=Archangium lipolyticum TaxID=2970465 RepID=UPI002149D723|nr:TetR/AcrR family transcriptional regulator [Archangium lipolyticum]